MSIGLNSFVNERAITEYPAMDRQEINRRVTPMKLPTSRERPFIIKMKTTPNTDSSIKNFCLSDVLSFKKNEAKIVVRIGVEANNIPASEDCE